MVPHSNDGSILNVLGAADGSTLFVQTPVGIDQHIVEVVQTAEISFNRVGLCACCETRDGTVAVEHIHIFKQSYS